jgi:5-methylcytosine-specific restriction endonuclease McrA
MEKKICTTCQYPYDLTDDNFYRTSKGAFVAKCKSCVIAKTRSYASSHKEECNKRSIDWQRKNPDKRAAISKKYTDNNKEKIAKYRNTRREKITEYNKGNKPTKSDTFLKYCYKCSTPKPTKYFGFCYRNLDGFQDMCQKCKNINTANYRSRLGTFKLTPTQWDAICANYGDVCAYCYKTTEDMQIDHFFPVSKGGKHELSNLVPACKHCNCSKNNKNPYDWICEKFSPFHFMLSFPALI